MALAVGSDRGDRYAGVLESRRVRLAFVAQDVAFRDLDQNVAFAIGSAANAARCSQWAALSRHS